MKIFYIGFILNIIILTTNAQDPVANFSIKNNITSSCEFLRVELINTSENISATTNFKWEFGDNSTPVITKDAVHVYSKPGNYTIKLTVTDNHNSSFKITLVTVYKLPEINFKADSVKGCFPLSAKFTDLTKPGSGKLTKWTWSFGDAGGSNLQNPTYVFNKYIGSCNISLEVEDENNCRASLTKSNFITTLSKPTPNFSADKKYFCTKSNEQICFTNLTQGTNLSYKWDFGNGMKSYAKDTCVGLAKQIGSYNISLTAINGGACSSTTTMNNYIEINSFKANFKSDISEACISSPVSFTDLSSSTSGIDKAQQWIWNFGDNKTSYEQNPTHIYSQPGVYTITLIAISNNNCNDTLIKKNFITVKPSPTSLFKADITRACNAPLTVHFTDLSTGAVSYLWNFGDGVTETIKNPTHIFQSNGIYNIMLKVTGSNGCSNSSFQNNLIKIKNPSANFESDPKEGCIPLKVQFQNQTIDDLPLTKIKWYLGFKNITSTETNPVVIFPDTGEFNISLSVVDSLGCKDSITKKKFIQTGKKYADFKVDKNSVCFNSKVQFTDLSGGGKYIDSWIWNFGKNEEQSSERNPLHLFNKDTGTFTVTLITKFNGCADTLVKKNYINVLPPKADFYAKDLTDLNDSIGCKSPYKAYFRDYSTGADSSYWDFGDLTPIVKTSKQKYINHTYKNPGFYKVRLITVNKANNCRDTITKTDPRFGGYIKVSDLKPNFKQDTYKNCQYKNFKFKNSSFTNNGFAQWLWNFGDGSVISTNIDSIFYSYSKSGIYSTKMVVTDQLGCKDSITKQNNDTVLKLPSPRFKVDKTVGCKPLNVSFTDMSVTTNYKIKFWGWFFGDNTSPSTDQNPHHSYTTRGSYSVRLTVIDSLGCDSTLFKPDYIKPSFPYPDFNSPSILCRYNQLNLTDNSTGDLLKYKWYFGDGDSSTLKNPSHFFKNIDTTTIFNLKLKLTDINNCDSVTTKQIIVSQPKMSFSASKTSVNCPPLFTKFFTVNPSNDITKLIWDFGDGSSPITTKPTDSSSITYNNSGNYFIKVLAVNTHNCIDTLTSDSISKKNYIIVDGPSGSFSTNVLTNCSPATVLFNAEAKKTAKYNWVFEDGSDTISTIDSASHRYTQGGFFYPSLILQDAKSQPCFVQVKSKQPIKIISTKIKFNMNQNTACQSPAVVNFIDSSSVFPDTNIINVSRIWDFGDNTTSTEKNPTHTYNAPGKYTVTLKIKADSCESYSTPNYFKIFSTPNLKYYNPDSISCFPLKAHFIVIDSVIKDTVKKWSWNFNDGSQPDTLKNPVHQFSATNLYNIILNATFKNGCTYAYSQSKQMTVYPLPIAKINVSKDTIEMRTPLYFSDASSGNIKKWLWNLGDSTKSTEQNFYHNYTIVGDIPVTLKVTTADSCVDSDTIIVTIIPKKEIPNAFTPDNDGINDVFMKNVDLKILNRWGQILYEGKDGWNGYYKGELVSPGTYFYIILIEDYKGKDPVKYTGSVTLIRK